MDTRRSLFFLFSIFICYGLSAQESQITFLEEEITIDGQLDEVVWNKLPIHTNFTNYLPENNKIASNQTEVKMFYNETSLFVAAIYHDTTPKVQLSSLKRDDNWNTIAMSDSFVMALDTYNQQQSGYYFAINGGGALVDALIERTGDSFRLNTSWNTIWKGSSSVQGNKKIYEIEIPLKSLGYKKENTNWGVMFHVRDIKRNEWTTYTHMDRNYRIFDLRFSKQLTIDQLASASASRITLIPSITVDHHEKTTTDTKETTITPSLDLQYNISSSLKLDATIHPDFSQIDVDQQVTNLTRFAINFPERRNFFLENSDLFSGLGINSVNPFYSRRVGALSDIIAGMKISGNLTKKTRIGVLDVITKEEDSITPSQNYGAFVAQHQISNAFTGTAFLINRQEMDNLRLIDDYNRVAGINLNYKSANNKWTGLANYGKSFGNEYSGENEFYHMGVWYSTAETTFDVSVHKVGRNYITDVGFVPRLTNYDATNDVVVREGYTQARVKADLRHFSKERKHIDSYRYLLLDNEMNWNENGKLIQSSTFFNNALWFKDLSSMYFNVIYDYNDLKYAFDVLRNGNSIQPDVYRYVSFQAGYNSVRNKKVQYGGSLRHGSYYNGTRSRLFSRIEYRLLPIARLRLIYEVNKIDLKALGEQTFHLARFTGEVFFSERFNWTTYVQYNTQLNNFNINSRLQWEYKPLSYLYLVITDNFDKHIHRKNWGVALKLNYRLDI
ncbi:DUF5916 domain-containing protein [Aquimarina hainanensis]|uniref:DUF5916 domain-containing protein n=1 Tax=Aquimarina hainanensis TaxID=1578017 RepID=A0ABW5ND23_9FLAO